ncbi:hypothetical protein CY35_03G011600 [Sphagnum magellanicum]|nr:hypothetical protein CY35_03G011600 [Sphagnum magellanicum]
MFFLGVERRKDLATMVRTYKFAAMVAVTYVALNEADSLFGWLARRQESKTTILYTKSLPDGALITTC